jgi:hypothetical protein
MSGNRAKTALFYLRAYLLLVLLVIVCLLQKSLLNGIMVVVRSIQKLRWAKAQSDVASRMQEAESVLAELRSQFVLR